jgi:hypothetical protein
MVCEGIDTSCVIDINQKSFLFTLECLQQPYVFRKYWGKKLFRFLHKKWGCVFGQSNL